MGYVIKYNGRKIVHPELFSSYRKAKRELLVFLDMMPEYAGSLTINRINQRSYNDGYTKLNYEGRNWNADTTKEGQQPTAIRG